MEFIKPRQSLVYFCYNPDYFTPPIVKCDYCKRYYDRDDYYETWDSDMCNCYSPSPALPEGTHYILPDEMPCKNRKIVYRANETSLSLKWSIIDDNHAVLSGSLDESVGDFDFNEIIYPSTLFDWKAVDAPEYWLRSGYLHPMSKRKRINRRLFELAITYRGIRKVIIPA
jgi:hypothetical protein